jgi:nucleoside 2-deoxyribosyltransferase
MRIYLAAPLFSHAEREYNERLAATLRDAGHEVVVPQRECIGLDNPQTIFNICRARLDHSNVVVAILDGPDPDSGTSWECGYAYAKGIPILGLRTDFRFGGDDGEVGVNLMLSRSARAVHDSVSVLLISLESLNAASRV